MSLEVIATVMDKWQDTGESLGGIFFQCPDLVIVREPGVPAIMEVIDGLVDGADERLEDVFQKLENYEDDDPDEDGR